MGICAGTVTPGKDPKTKEIEIEMEAERKKNRGLVKILLLGCGETGKSTFLKQVKAINNIEMIPDVLLQKLETVIRTNVITSCKLILNHIKPDPTRTQETKETYDFIVEEEDIAHPLWGKHIEIFAAQECVAEVVKNKIDLELALPVDVRYFFPRTKAIFSDNYRPTENDVLYSRSVTTGIHEFEFIPAGTDTTVHFIDVGGQASERRKWINQFQHVQAILFFSALDSFCLPATPPYRYRLEEELAVWTSVQQIIPPHILFIFLQNKSDILAEIIKTHPLSRYFKDISGPDARDMDACVKYLRAKFQAKWRGQRTLTFHVTNSLDQDIIRRIWHDVREDIFMKQLQNIGFTFGSASEASKKCLTV